MLSRFCCFVALVLAHSAHAQEVKSGLQTAATLDSEPPGFRVTWIRWDSGFRGTGLRIVLCNRGSAARARQLSHEISPATRALVLSEKP